MDAKDLAVGLAGGRIAIGVVSLLMPAVVGRAMMGPDGDSGGARLFLRVVAARDLALGIGVLAALDRDAPVHGWLRASAVVDGLDAAVVPVRVRVGGEEERRRERRQLDRGGEEEHDATWRRPSPQQREPGDVEDEGADEAPSPSVAPDTGRADRRVLGDRRMASGEDCEYHPCE